MNDPAPETAQPGTWSETEFLRGVLAASADCIKVLDLDGKLVFMTDAGKRIMEVSDFNAIKGCPWPDFWSGQGNVDARAAVETAKAGGVGHFQGAANTMAGTSKFWDVQVTPIRGANGSPEMLLSVSRDITASWEAENWLENERDRLRRMFEQAPGFIAMLAGPEHVFELTNPAYLQLIGHRDVIGKPVREALPDIAGQGFYELLDGVFTTGEAFVGSAMPVILQPVPGGKTERRYIDLVYQPLKNGSGRVIGVFAQGTDVTAQVVAQQDARTRENDFQALAQAMPNHVWTSPPNGELDWFNDRVYAYSGATESELAGNGWISIVHPDDVEAAHERWQAALVSGTTYETEFRLRRADGLYRWHIARALPIRADDGVIDRWIGTNTDIEEQKESARSLEELNATLEHRVEERTAAIAEIQAQLQQSQKMEAVGQLTGGLAHDFNNLLAGISGSLDLVQTRLKQGRLADVDRFILAAQGASKRAAALTHRLLAFSRRQTLDPKVVNVNRLVSGIEDLIRRTVGPQVTVEVVGAVGLWNALVDPSQLENSLLNLCINARDAMPDGGRLTIETANKWIDERTGRERDLSSGQYLSLSVTDTGTGMSPETITRAFDPFYTTKPLGQGTGLGLSMVYGFARQSGGQVRIYSELGQGTTMCIYVPRHHGEEGKIEAESSLERMVPTELGETVLIVDDEPTVRMLVTEVLRELGYTAIEAGDGPSALKVLNSTAAIDLLVTDVGLPGGINGRQLADAARTTRPNLKVLFITGYAENAVVGNGHLDPGMDVLTKPFALDALANRIETLISS